MKSFFRLSLLLAVSTLAHAHFVFVVPDQAGGSASVFISETLKPDPAVGLQYVEGAKLIVNKSDGSTLPLTLTKGSQAYSVSFPAAEARVIHGTVDLGFSQSGRAKQAYVLMYYPKAILGNAFDGKTAVGDQAPVEIVPTGKPGAVKLQLLAHGKPVADATITVIFPDASQKEVKTDSNGQTETLAQTGRYGAWARYWETASGEREGKKYEEVRNYATLVFDAAVVEAGAATKTLPGAKTADLFAKLPEASASFGSVVSDGWLYIYGGHVARTHSYSTDAVSGKFNRLRLTGAAQWEELPAGPSMQGMNLAAYNGKIYRIGGMTPHNNPGKPADNFSVADCARFDPVTKTWEALPALPEPRSSHDVVVIGSQLIVTGGWALKGKNDDWSETLAILDLSAPQLQWTTAKQPFKRRALMAAAFDGKMYVIGGFDDKNRIVRNVSIYDPQTNAWSEGPEIPAGPGLAFAPAAGIHEGKLYVSVSDGTLYRLDASGRVWEKVGSSTPRLAHRIASAPQGVLVIGGASDGKNSDLIEMVPVTR